MKDPKSSFRMFSSLMLVLLLVGPMTVSMSAAGRPKVVAARLFEFQESFLEEEGSDLQSTSLDLEQIQKVADLLREEVTLEPNGCSCSQVSKSCSCCARISIKKIKFESTVCANVAYDPRQIGFVFTLTSNGRVIFQKSITVKNPPALCVGVPRVKLAQLCIQFYNLDWDNKHFSGCSRLQAKVVKKVVAQVELGCFNLGPFNQNLGPEILPAYLEFPNVTQSEEGEAGETIRDYDSVEQSRDNSVLKFRSNEPLEVMSRLLHRLQQAQAADED